MSTVLIVGAAPAQDEHGFYARLLAGAGVVIAADAAGEWCAGLGRVPDVTVGDFDSAAQGAAERLRAAGSGVVTLPTAKDVSDLDACVDEARRRGVRELTFAAAFTGRVDHNLASFGSVLAAADLGVRVEEPGWWAVPVTPEDPVSCLRLPGGTVFTVIAPGGATGVTIEGCVYPLSDAALEPLSSLGLSNIASGDGVGIRTGSGRLLVIVQR
jgi:thiamine pyrophosphokinase